MITRRAPAFAGIPEYYVDDAGAPLLSEAGGLATDRDLDRLLNRPDVASELDRITLEMAAYHRARGERLERWLLDAEISAFMRIRRRANA